MGRHQYGRWIAAVGMLAVGAASANSELNAQESPSGVGAPVQLADATLSPRVPMFFAVAPGTRRRVDARDAAVLKQRVSLHLINVPLDDALMAIEHQSATRFDRGGLAGTQDQRVTIQVDGLTVVAVLTELLVDAGLDVQVTPDNVLRLVRRPAVAFTRQATGRIEGRVRDAETGQPLAGAAVVVEATPYRVAARPDGQYAIVGVPAGPHTVTARLLGHTPLSKQVDVRADSAVHLDFALAQAAASLEQVVTTAVGEQRRVEVGNDIATIDADSIVKSGPITSLTDIISGRAPGVDVLGSSGVTGSPVRIRIRGLSSLQLSNDPIVYIDGMRINSDPGGNNATAEAVGRNWPLPSRLNDVNPDEIASIEVLKGPSASSEYGTDAANGVIVIKTKRGEAGLPHWDFNTEQGITNVPVHQPLEWYGWGHTTTAPRAAVECPLTAGFGGPTIGNGGCALDSVTTYQPLDHASTSVLTDGHGQQYNAQVSGGAQQLLYFLAGSYASNLGVLRLDPAERQLMISQGQSIPSNVDRPNIANSVNVRGRFTVPIGTNADLAVSTGYLSNYQRSGDQSDIMAGAQQGLGYRDSAGFGYGFCALYQVCPRYYFQNIVSDAISRFTGGATANWRPTGWLATHLTFGLDNGNQNDLAFRRPGPDPTYFSSNPFAGYSVGGGFRSEQHLTTQYYTIDLGATGSGQLASDLSTKTSVGLQYNDQRGTGPLVYAFGISSNSSLNGAQVTVPTEIDNESKTLGSYIEETIGWHEHLFLTGAVRVDAGSGFGTQANSAVYPKASASWVLWDTPQQSVRLRAAYGASGVQPRSGAALTLYSPATAFTGGQVIAADTLASVANTRLKPERQGEFEGGLDASVLARRVDVALTYYSKLSRDALVDVTLPASAGARTEQENIGSVRNYGLEGSVTIHALTTRFVQWDATLGGSTNQNRLVNLASGVPPIFGGAAFVYTQYRDVPGYPIYGLWAPTLHYADANHDGIIEPNEVSESDSSSFIGSSVPTRELTFSTSLGLWGGRIRVNAQVDHRGGVRLQNYSAAQNASFNPSDAELNDPHLPLWRQARAVESGILFYPMTNAYIEDASFTRWRELSISYRLPTSLTRAVRVRSGSVTLSGRNLALWTHYTGADPEVANPYISDYAAPGDVGVDAWTIPQLRSWRVRVDVGL